MPAAKQNWPLDPNKNMFNMKVARSGGRKAEHTHLMQNGSLIAALPMAGTFHVKKYVPVRRHSAREPRSR